MTFVAVYYIFSLLFLELDCFFNITSALRCYKPTMYKNELFQGKILLIFMGNWLWCIWFHEFFFGTRLPKFSGPLCIVKNVTSVRGKELFLLQIIHIFAHSDSKIFCEASQNRLELLFFIAACKTDIYFIIY